MDGVKISVIIPTFNEAKQISRCLNQFDWEDERLEVIVVDGGSADATEDIVKKYRDVAFFKSEKGRAVQMNKGALKSSGDVLLFLHADTLLPRNALQKVREIFENEENGEVVGGFFRIRFDVKRWIYRIFVPLFDLPFRWLKLSFGDRAIFVRKQAFFAIGEYSRIPILEDLELCRKLKKVGKVVNLPMPVITSARRYEKAPLKTLLLTALILTAYLIGIPPQRLGKLYKDIR